MSEDNTSQDIFDLRSEIKNELRLDQKRATSNALRLIENAEKNGLDIFEKSNNETRFNHQTQNWTEDLLLYLCHELDDNFTKDRIHNILVILKHLRETGHPEFQISDHKIYAVTDDEAVEENKPFSLMQPKMLVIVAIIALTFFAFAFY